VNQIGHWLRLY